MITLDEVTVIRAPIQRCFDLARSVEVHLAGNVHWGEQAVAERGVTSGLQAAGDCVTWRARHFGVWHRLTSQITRFDIPHLFQDTMTEGIFATMQHDHFFRALDATSTEMRDVFRFAAPLGAIGRLAEAAFLGRYMRTLLLERNEVIRRIAESAEWERYVPS